MRSSPALLTVLCATAVVGCSAGSDGPRQPPVSAFTDGTCRVAAPELLQIGRDARRLGAGGEVDKGVLASLTSAQDRLDALSQAAEPALKPAFTKLVVSVGLVRLQARVGTYRTAQGTQLQRDADAAIAVCTTRPS